MYAKLNTPPSAEPLDLAEVKLHCRVDHDAENALLTALIAAARQQAENRTGRALITQTWELIGDEPPCHEILLPRPPVSAVTSFSYIDPDGVTRDYTDYRLDKDAAPAAILPAYGSTWPVTRCTPGAVRIRCTCGYGADAAAVPAPIRQWMLLQVGHWYANREAVGDARLAPLPYVDGLIDPYCIVGFVS